MTTDQQKQLLGALMLGADLARAAAYVRTTPDQVRSFAEEHPDFQTELDRATAAAEVTHLRTIAEAAKEVKNWRASVWWLRHAFPDRYNRRPHQVNAAELREYHETLMNAIAEHLDPESQVAIHETLGQLLTRD